jgi:hypothetical protein
MAVIAVGEARSSVEVNARALCEWKKVMQRRAELYSRLPTGLRKPP